MKLICHVPLDVSDVFKNEIHHTAGFYMEPSPVDCDKLIIHS